ncbi:hypothetical protein ACOMHN_023737 [Nucella lapillus]
METERGMRRGAAMSATPDDPPELDGEQDVTTPLLPAASKARHEGEAAVAGEGAGGWRRWVCSYASYVLLMMVLTYLLNQLDRYLLAVTARPMAQDVPFGDMGCGVNSSLGGNSTPRAHNPCNATSREGCVETEGGGVCVWERTGQGVQYQLLAGPVFVLVYTVAGVGVSLLAHLQARRTLLGLALLLWSLATALTGLVTHYWHLVVLRLLLGFGEAGCTPLAVSLLTDYFPSSYRGLVVAVYNLGIYSGYSLAYALGNFITLANINGQGWRWAYFLSGIPGMVLAGVILLTVKEPPPRSAPDPQGHDLDPQATLTPGQKLLRTLRPFLSVSVLLLCLGGSVRNAAGYVWAYNTQPYFQAVGQTQANIASYMSWIPLVFGSLGVILGGQVSDLVLKRTGVMARVLVLSLSQLLAAPFAAGTLYFDPPYSYIMQIPTYIIGEMWVGVALTVLVELVDPRFKTQAIAVYLFLITNLGGNVPLLVPPIQKAFQHAGAASTAAALRGTLYILYPGLYVGGGLLFLVTLCSIRRDQRNQGYSRMAEHPPPSPHCD